MKAIVGVDVMGLYNPALNFLGRLAMPHSEVELLRIDEPSTTSPSEGFAWTAEVLEMQRKTDENVIHDAGDAVEELGMSLIGKNVFIGSPAQMLMERAEAIHADIIAIGSTRKSKYGSFFFGSVGRALAIGSRHSVLIAKGEVAKTGKITAVFATDHSQYADEAVVLFARLNPKGIEKVILVTAIDHDMIEGASEIEKEKFRTYMQNKSSSLVDHLKEAGIEAEYRIVTGEFDSVIDEQMTKFNAELLILGAQGHGFMERLFIGSSCLQQVVATPHSVLILRP